MINDYKKTKKVESNIVNIKFTEENKWHSFIFKLACVTSEKILSEQEFKKAQIRKVVVEKTFERIYNAFESKNIEEYKYFENLLKDVNESFEELKGSVPTVEIIEEEQQVNTPNNNQIKQEIITQEETIEEVSVEIQKSFTKVSSKKLPKELMRLKKDNK